MLGFAGRDLHRKERAGSSESAGAMPQNLASVEAGAVAILCRVCDNFKIVVSWIGVRSKIGVGR